MTLAQCCRSPKALLQPLFGLLGITFVAACSSSSGGGGGATAAPMEAGATSTTTYPATDSNASCAATVTQGSMQGKVAGATCEYLGIPYGAPPTQSLRFMPPTPAPSWPSMRNATAYGPSCLQAGSTLGSVGATSEDCLSLNIFTPTAAPAKPLPVMVFIYGGAFTSGSSSLYDGQALSERGPVLVVTMNYRLGALGFLSLPELDALRPGKPSGSDGIRDQQLALQWVQDNIATFHGDKTNVTVFGESAGSTSTCIHIVSPGSQGLANRYIMESGACVGKSPELNTKAETVQISEELATTFCAGGVDGGTPDGAAPDGGDFDATSPGVVNCLQIADPTQLMTWVPAAGAPTTPLNTLLGNLTGPPFAPTVEGTGGVLPDLPSNLIASGSFNKNAAVLAGTNENEWGLFVYLATNAAFGGSASSPLNIMTAAQLNQGIEMIYGTQAAMVEGQYPATDATAPQVFIDLVTDYGFRCPTRQLARSLLAQGTKDYFLYSYDIGKAWHSFELVPLFDVTELTLLGAAKPSSGYDSEMQGYWAQFATTGNPNGVGDGGAPVWPSYTTATDQYLELMDPTPMAIANFRKVQCDFWDSFTPASSL